MRRFDPDHPMRLAYVIGTFSAHPLVMGAMNEFLRWVTRLKRGSATMTRTSDVPSGRWKSIPPLRRMPYRCASSIWPTVWTILFQQPGRYNWLLQYYLRAEGVTLSWVGTGRCLSNMAFTQQNYTELQVKTVTAASRMKQDGWWLEGLETARRKAMKSRLTLGNGRQSCPGAETASNLLHRSHATQT